MSVVRGFETRSPELTEERFNDAAASLNVDFLCVMSRHLSPNTLWIAPPVMVCSMSHEKASAFSE